MSRYASDALEARRARGVSTLVTGPAVEPVSESYLVEHSRLNSISFNLEPLRIAAARQWAEHYTSRAFIEQTWAYTVDWIADGGVPLLLPKVPLLSVVSIKTYDPEDVETSVSALNYRVDTATEPGRVFIDTAVGYWNANPRYYGRMVATYKAGYGTTAESVPALIRQAIALLAGEFYERLEASTDLKLAEVPFGIRTLLDPYRVTA